MQICDGWRDLLKFLKEYWGAYGGFKTFVMSPYLHIAIVVTGITFSLWTEVGWWEIMLSIIPSILGFTIGGFAIVLALGTGEFGAALSTASKPNDDVLKSGMGKLSAAFSHFIVVQFLAILLAIVASACSKTKPIFFLEFLGTDFARSAFWGICWLIGVYALLLAVATTTWIFTDMKLLIRFQKKQYARKIEALNAKSGRE